MNEERNLYDEILDKKFTDEYCPNPLEDFKTFKKRKKLALDKKGETLLAKAFDGLLLLGLADEGNERTTNLIHTFLTADSNPAFNDPSDSMETYIKKLQENNPFGLIEEDLVRFNTIIDKAVQLEMYQEASNMQQAMTILFPLRMDCWLRLADIEYNYFFDYDKVLAIYEDCSKMFEHPAVYIGMGTCHVKGNQLPLAEESFKKCIELCDKLNENDLKEIATQLLSQVQSILSKK